MWPFLTFLSQIWRGLDPILYRILRNPLWNVFLNIFVASTFPLFYPIFLNKWNLLKFAATLLFQEKTTFHKQTKEHFYSKSFRRPQHRKFVRVEYYIIQLVIDINTGQYPPEFPYSGILVTLNLEQSRQSERSLSYYLVTFY